MQPLKLTNSLAATCRLSPNPIRNYERKTGRLQNVLSSAHPRKRHERDRMYPDCTALKTNYLSTVDPCPPPCTAFAACTLGIARLIRELEDILRAGMRSSPVLGLNSRKGLCGFLFQGWLRKGFVATLGQPRSNGEP